MSEMAWIHSDEGDCSVASSEELWHVRRLHERKWESMSGPSHPHRTFNTSRERSDACTVSEKPVVKVLGENLNVCGAPVIP